MDLCKSKLLHALSFLKDFLNVVLSGVVRQVFQKQLVRDERDEFAVGRLFAPDVDPHPEHRVDRLRPLPVPRHFDPVPDRTLYLARARPVFLRFVTLLMIVGSSTASLIPSRR